MPKVDCIEARKKLTKEDFSLFVKLLETGDSQWVVGLAAFGVLLKMAFNGITAFTIGTINFLRLLFGWMIAALWYVSDAVVRYSAIVSIPTLAILYLHDNDCCTEASFRFSNWVLWFVYIKTGCYVLLIAISGLAYLMTHVRMRHNKSITKIASASCAIHAAPPPTPSVPAASPPSPPPPPIPARRVIRTSDGKIIVIH